MASQKEPETTLTPAQMHPQKSQDTPQEIAAEEKAKSTSSSKGERLFDWLTYGGISFAGVFIATMPWTYYTKYGSGKKFHEWVVKGLKNKGVSEHVAEQTFNTLVLGSLGNVAIIPIKFLENHKPAIVDKFNDWLGDKSHDASVDKDPKQSWTSLILARVAAYTAVFVSLQGAVAALGGKKFQKFEEKFAEHVVCKPLGYATHTPGMAKTVANETKAFRYGKIGALDVFATGAATILLYLGSRMFARKNEAWKATHAGTSEHTPAPAGAPAAAEPAATPETQQAEPA
ncbi:MAG: hypothetical protein EBV03_12505, partial [Proteobacteria bacterium]|nr:hypothetical protein [Pseudomonadota bacterium]